MSDERVEAAVMGGPLVRESSLLARVEALEARVSRLEASERDREWQDENERINREAWQ